MSGELVGKSAHEDEPLAATQALLTDASLLARDVPERELVWLCACAIVHEMAAVRANLERLGLRFEEVRDAE